MIAIVVQENNQTLKVVNFWIKPEDNKTIRANAVCVVFSEPEFNYSMSSLYVDVATYDTEEQEKYVYGKINEAIEQGKTLYRMPSVEEVEKELRIENISSELSQKFCKTLAEAFKPKE